MAFSQKTGLMLAGVLIAAGAGWYLLSDTPLADVTPEAIAAPPGNGAPLAEVVVPATLTAEAETGKTYYEAVCASCHGANAAGQDGVAPPLVHKIYEPSHHGDMAFVMAARNGVPAHHWPFGNMPPVEQRLTDAEIAAIVAYVRALQRANGIN